MNPTEFRRHLHAHPELSFKEHDTAAFIADRLTELGIEHRPIARTGWKLCTCACRNTAAMPKK